MNSSELETALTAARVGSEVRSRIVALVESTGAMAWPVDERALAEHLGAKLARGSSNLAWDDLCLAFAAAHQVEQAWRALRQRIGPSLRTSLNRVLPSVQAEDLEQTLFAEFASKGASPLLGYAGEGPLAGWVVVTATRRAWKLANSRKSTAPVDDDALLDRVVEGQRDPALELFKRQHGETFRGCIKSAFARLSAKDRNLLRLHHLDGVQTAELARVHGVHRATVVRWLADARTAFVSNFRDEFGAKLGAPRLEIDSLARVFQSGLDISLPMESADSGVLHASLDLSST
jgi:RNA polymerase sigma-70 factor (ECF subfamily)